MQTNNRFSVSEALSFGWKSVLDNFGFFFLVACTYVGTAMITCLSLLLILALLAFGFSLCLHQSIDMWRSSLMDVVRCIDSCPWLAIIVSICLILMVVFLILFFVSLSLGYMKITLDIYDLGNSRISRLFSFFRMSLKALILGFIIGLMTAFGLLFLIIPGIYIMVRFFFSFFVMVDKNTGIIESLQSSYAMTAGQGWPLFGLLAVSLLINMVGSWMIIGTLITWPLIMCAQAYAYRKLSTLSTVSV